MHDGLLDLYAGWKMRAPEGLGRLDELLAASADNHQRLALHRMASAMLAEGAALGKGELSGLSLELAEHHLRLSHGLAPEAAASADLSRRIHKANHGAYLEHAHRIMAPMLAATAEKLDAARLVRTIGFAAISRTLVSTNATRQRIYAAAYQTALSSFSGALESITAVPPEATWDKTNVVAFGARS